MHTASTACTVEASLVMQFLQQTSEHLQLAIQWLVTTMFNMPGTLQKLLVLSSKWRGNFVGPLSGIVWHCQSPCSTQTDSEA
jgi:hypothetical protein